MMTNEAFLESIRESFRTYLRVGTSRSTAKLKSLTRANCPYQQQRYEHEQPIAKGKVRHYKTTYRIMIHGLRLRLDREPTDSEIYAFLCEVNK